MPNSSLRTECSLHLPSHITPFLLPRDSFRQICDWILFMSTYGQQMDKALFLDYAERFDLLRPMQLFALMSVRYLGADASVYPFELPQR